jgi:glycosyltransferase involved in cell wall biosynthesis
MDKKDKEKLPISVVMVIYNEEKILARALESVHDAVDEIIIVHDGKCADKSIEIAKKYTDKIFELEHIGASERHRPFTYQKAKNDWILQLDADEYLSGTLKNSLKRLISDQVDIYEIISSVYCQEKHHFIFYKRMLFRKSAVYFIGATHEAVKPLNREAEIKKIEYPLMHEPAYNNLSFSVFGKKWKMLSKIQAKQLLENFSAIPKWNCPLDDWEQHRRIRLKHPILLGMIATPLFHTGHCIKNFLKNRDLRTLQMGIFAFLYHVHLYYYLNKYKKNEKY